MGRVKELTNVDKLRKDCQRDLNRSQRVIENLVEDINFDSIEVPQSALNKLHVNYGRRSANERILAILEANPGISKDDLLYVLSGDEDSIYDKAEAKYSRMSDWGGYGEEELAEQWEIIDVLIGIINKVGKW